MSQSRTSTGASAVKAGRSVDKTSRVYPSAKDLPPQAEGVKTRPKHENHKNRTKTKLPISVRCDLENALVDLCDSWFEEIKPHLVRNNIKLHVHNPDVTASCSSQNKQEPVCYHLDPGAALDRPRQKSVCYANSYAVQQTVLEAPCVKPLASNRCQSRLPKLVEVPHGCPMIPHRSSDKTILSNDGAHESKSRSREHVHSSTSPIVYNKKALPESSQSYDFNEGFPKKATAKKASQTDHPDLWTFASLLADPPPSSQHTDSRCKPWRDLLNTKQDGLFQHDFIEMLGRRNEEILGNIRKSSMKVGYPSRINLVSPKESMKADVCNKPPWR